MKETKRRKIQRILKSAAKHGKRHTMDRLQPVISRLTRPLTITALDRYWAWRVQ